jgi:hypothetical protein
MSSLSIAVVSIGICFPLKVHQISPQPIAQIIHIIQGFKTKICIKDLHKIYINILKGFASPIIKKLQIITNIPIRRKIISIKIRTKYDNFNTKSRDNIEIEILSDFPYHSSAEKLLFQLIKREDLDFCRLSILT